MWLILKDIVGSLRQASPSTSYPAGPYGLSSIAPPGCGARNTCVNFWNRVLSGSNAESRWRGSSRLRVGLVVDVHQLPDRDLGVFLGGGEARVTEHFLNGAQVGALAQQVGGEGVAQGVGA